MFDFLKRLFSSKPPEPKEVKPVTLANGRVARVDDRGNFLGWADPQP